MHNYSQLMFTISKILSHQNSFVLGREGFRPDIDGQVMNSGLTTVDIASMAWTFHALEPNNLWFDPQCLQVLLGETNRPLGRLYILLSNHHMLEVKQTAKLRPGNGHLMPTSDCKHL